MAGGLALRRGGRFCLVVVSVAGGLAHNIGQILTAMLLLETWQLAGYLPVLWLSGMAAGLVIGLLGGELVRRLPEELFR